MTEIIYQTDAYLHEFSATITSVDSETRAVVLDRSAFYPGGTHVDEHLRSWQGEGGGLQEQGRDQ